VDPSAEQVRAAAQAAAAADVTVFFCFDAHLHKGCKALLDALQASAKKLVFVLLRDPYDEEFAKPSNAVVTAFGFRLCQLEACIDKIVP
jgi:hypothetical protein